MNKKLKIGYVGLSHLGLNYLAASAKKNFFVIGVDQNNERVKNLERNIFEYKEPNLNNIIIKKKKNIIFSNDFKRLYKCDLVFISQDVQTDSKGNSDHKSLSKMIYKAIKNMNRNSILIVLSQMKPGFIRSIKMNHKNLYHQVETLIFGKAVNRALNPERIIIGCENKFRNIDKRYLKYLKKFNCPIIKMGYESAEITKISINLLLASSITTTNILSEICEKFSADWSEILPALRLDKRIGKFSYIKPGLGISGGNIERDIVTTSKLFKQNSKPKQFLNNFIENSNHMKLWIKRVLENENILGKKTKLSVGIIGASYKENTNSIKNSPILNLLKYFKKNSEIRIYEPSLKLKLTNEKISQINDLQFLLDNSELIIIIRPWINKKAIQNIAKSSINKYVIDPFRVVQIKNKNKKVKKYFTIGK